MSHMNTNRNIPQAPKAPAAPNAAAKPAGIPKVAGVGNPLKPAGPPKVAGFKPAAGEADWAKVTAGAKKPAAGNTQKPPAKK